MDTPAEKLTLDQCVTYEITLSGHTEAGISDCTTAAISRFMDERGACFTTIRGSFDQAGLHGLLRHLYELGYPLISVVWVEGL